MDKDHENNTLLPNTHFIGKRIYQYRRIPSTQQLAIFLAETNIINENGTVILADEQYDGKGRRNTKWISPKGGLWVSIIIKPNIEPKNINILSVIAAISVCETINEIASLESTIKWPNDIVIDNKKIAGIVIDSSINGNNIEYVVIGIGINIMIDVFSLNVFLSNNNILSQKVTSLHNELKNKCIDRSILLKHLLKKIEYYLLLVQNGTDYMNIIDIYKRLCSTLGMAINVYKNNVREYSAIAKDIDSDGGLILARENKLIEKIYYENISIREKKN
jgi:BirA family transcriptional regulator, biotin operon repressor / biotin---[acetyl-CoA-carboxylase] ligase